MNRRDVVTILGATACSAAVVGGLVFLVFLPMCSNKLSGEASVLGDAFVATSCHSGQRWNFVGVELEAADGRRLRVAQTPSGGGDVFVFAAHDERGLELGECAGLVVGAQHSTINNITNVEGSVTLDCKHGRGAVTGHVTFENCH
jgi:hypothetical protein